METVVLLRGMFLLTVWTKLCAAQLHNQRCDPFQLDKLLTDMSHSDSLWTHTCYSEAASAVFSSDHAASVLRRRRDQDFRNRPIFDEAEKNLERLLNSIHSESNIQCVELLVSRHSEAAAHFWFQDHPQLSGHTTLHAVSTTVTTENTTYPPIRCWNCSGLECLLYPDSHTGQLCPADQTFCMVSITDQSNDRHIDRSCASASTCDSLYLTQTLNDENCLDVERRILPSNTKCHFCCVGDNCNKPPALVPEVTSLYSKL